MTMETKNDRIAALESLFALSRDPVLGLREGLVVFSNSAAAGLFGRNVRGEAAAALLPELEELPEGEDSVTAAEAGGVVYTVTAVPQEDVTVLTLLAPEQDPAGLGADALSRLRMAAFRLRMSLDSLEAQAGEGEASRRAFHSYFELIHRIGQISDAGLLARNELACRMQPLDLGRLVEDLTHSAAVFTARRQTALSASVPGEECVVNADSPLLEKLLLILLSNALAHTGPEGHIRVRLRRDGERFYLSVDDDGEGMGPRELSYAFSLRRNPEPSDAASGAGLGLYIAQGIARLHGGSILLRSRTGEGTRVTVMLPHSADGRIRDACPPLAAGPEQILTELADLLPNEMYGSKYRD
jgi:signal transduction histidine kinase